MKNLSLGTRLFLACSLVSLLLFCGTYFYVKGFSDRREIRQAEESFDHAQGRLLGLLKARNQTIGSLSDELEHHPKSTLARAEFEAIGLAFAINVNDRPQASGLALTDEDKAALSRAFSAQSEPLRLSSGRYLVRGLHVDPTVTFLLLFPLAELERASHELLEAFFVAGIALLLLTSVVAQILAREISRPLINLRNRVRAMAESIGLDPPSAHGDEIGEIAGSYLDFAQHLQTAFEHKKLALEELEAYKAELLRVNANLHRRLFQVKVLLSLWSERDKALDVKDFLSRFLEALLPGLPFEYGCVIIRPIADMGSETIFAKKVTAGQPPKDLEDSERAGTLWTDIIDPGVKEFLNRESSAALETHSVRVNAVTGCMRPGVAPSPITVLSFRLKQGEEPLGSVHFLTETASPQITVGLNEFLLNLSAQVSAQLQLQALNFGTRLDPLTRLYNRGYLNDRLREEVVRCSRKHEPFSVVLLDIDHFKRVNSEYGQQAADEVLRGVASLLKSSCRGSDAVCRFAGAVLAIVLADTPLSGAKIFAENVRKAVEAHPFPIPNGAVKVTVSLGIAEFPGDGDGVDALLAQADHALMDAKESGRNTWKTVA